MKITKKLILSVLIPLFVFPVFPMELIFKALPTYNISLEENFDNSFGATAGFDLNLFTVRSRDNIFLSLEGTASQIKASGIDSLWLFDGSFGLGYELRFLDRFSVSAEGNIGLWSVSEDEEQNFPAASGLSYGGRGYFNFYVLPEFSLSAFGGLKSYANSDSSFNKNIELGVALKYNFSRGLFGHTEIHTDEKETSSIFPVFFSYYADHSFGKVTFTNREPTDLTDVEVQVFIEEFMTKPNTAVKFERIKRGETFSADLLAFLDETILTNLTPKKTSASVILKYKSLGKTKTYTESLELSAFGRNNMNWADDKRAAAFVSGKDASAALFARLVQATVRDELSPSKNTNIQYAAALFGSLKAYGMNYVIDPSSAFTDNIGSDSVDFLQFPYQTILYHGGDCDDLSILNCALFEAIGIETAFITVPGHIYIAFDSGVSVKNASSISDGMYIVQDDKVWIPLEITLCQDTFALERQTGFREWKKYPNERALIPLKEAWAEYKPVSIPDSEVKIELPRKEVILREFKSAF
ncbi:MAG: hypothetical protein IJ630_12700 [Treponema sp.]|nr:hypothetical protein [Treponema sp.]